MLEKFQDDAPTKTIDGAKGKILEPRTMMTVEALARRWDLNVKTVYEMIKRGEIFARRCGRAVRIPVAVVVSFESQGRVDAGRK